MPRLRKLLLSLLMLVLPVQGMAAVFAPLNNAANALAATTMPCHEHHAAHQVPAAGDDATVPDTAHDADAANHLCCHQVLTCAPTRVLNTPAHKFSEVSRFVLPLATLFIPDSPDRPPRG